MKVDHIMNGYIYIEVFYYVTFVAVLSQEPMAAFTRVTVNFIMAVFRTEMIAKIVQAKVNSFIAYIPTVKKSLLGS